MKHYTSKTLKLIALLHMAYPLTYLLHAAILFDIPAAGCVRILLNLFYYVVSIVAMTAGYGLWEMRRWSWYAFIFATVLTIYQNALVVQDYGESNQKALAFVASCLIVLGMTYRVAREVRVPYFFPKIRWWESNPRYRLTVPARIRREDGSVIDGQILDLSIAGCFVKLRSDLRIDERVDLDFTVYSQRVEAPGAVVWQGLSAVTHPKGIGVKFSLLPKLQRRALRVIVRRIRVISGFYRRSRYLMNPEDFNRRWIEIESKELPKIET